MVFDGLSGYKTTYYVSSDDWLADIEATTGLQLFRPNTSVRVVDFQGDETTPHAFFFEKGDEKLNILIVERLSVLCGAFYVFPDTGTQPLLVTPGTDPEQAIKEWQRW